MPRGWITEQSGHPARPRLWTARCAVDGGATPPSSVRGLGPAARRRGRRGGGGRRRRAVLLRGRALLRRRRAVRGGRLRRRGGLAAVGAVEARALEDHADRAVDLPYGRAALRALAHGGVGEGLHHLELVLALGVGAGVLVRGHGDGLPGRAEVVPPGL